MKKPKLKKLILSLILVVLLTGNVLAAPSPQTEGQIHIVQVNDTLSGLANEFYGDPLVRPIIVMDADGSDATAAEAGQQPMLCRQDYIVQQDDWLSKVSAKYYNDSLAYPAIFEATKAAATKDRSYATITDVDLIEVGWKLCIPDQEVVQGRFLNPGTTTAPPENYIIYQSFLLTQALHGIDGALQLLLDARLTDEMLAQLQFIEDINSLPEFAELPLQNGLLRIVDRHGQALTSQTLERGLATLDKTSLYSSNKPTYVLNVDFSIGWGSYNGPVTSFFEINSGKLDFLNAINQQTGEVKPITVLDSLKTGWKIFPAPDGNSKDILLVKTRPDFNDESDELEFKLSYIRFHFDGRNWVRLERSEEGYWESEGFFPDILLFP